jgi:ACS family hexuronate transporter-like MFS transporter
VFNIGASIGSVLAPPLVVWAVLAWSWRAAFVLTGAFGLVWVVLWLLFYRSPEDHPAMTEAERAHIAAGQEAHLAAAGVRPSVLSILRQGQFWGIALPRFLADPTWGTLSFWVPLYLTQTRGFDLKQIALFAWMPFVAADVGCLAGPVVAHFLQRRGVSLINARRIAFSLGAVLMTGMMFVGKVESAYAAIALLCLGGFAHQTLSVTVITMASDLFRKDEVATVAGLAGMMGNLGLLIFSLLIGGLVTRIGYDPFFVALGVLDILGAVLLWTLVKDRSAKGATA